MKRILSENYVKVKNLVEEQRESIEKAARELLKVEVLDEECFKKLINIKADFRKYAS